MTDIEEQLRQLEGQYTDSSEEVSSEGEEDFNLEDEVDLEFFSEKRENVVSEAGEEENEVIDTEELSEDQEETPRIRIIQESSKKKSKKQKKKQKKNQQAHVSVEKSSDSEVETAAPAFNIEEANFSSDEDDRKRHKKGKKKNKKNKPPNSKSDTITDTIEVPESNSKDTDKVEVPVETNELNEGKKNKKSKSKKSNLKTEDEESGSPACAQCSGTFPSKNKLFDHLKKTGHAVHLPPTAGVQESGKKKRRK